MTAEPVNRENAEILDDVLRRSDALRKDPLSIYPWLLRPCRVRTLLVTDGGLDFSGQSFGLSTFVKVLVDDDRHYVEFDITLAHLRSDVTDQQVMTGEPGIVRSIKDFRFDDPGHFTPTMYDQVWLFGIDSFYRSPSYATRNARPRIYPADRLSDRELVNLSTFMNQGGGLFATGDHGLLGRGLSGSVARARSMRLWNSTSPDSNVDEVSMSGPRRNDTNRLGHDAVSQFDDQSDDIPQVIQPKLYSAWISPFFRIRWPHPLLCGPGGIIRVLPDHPHEGECVLPSSLTGTYPFDGTREYPDALSGGGPLAPEIIARSTVPAGNTAGGKKPTVAQSFGAISAYDGHRAGIGRVVCDATWHHFTNVNLIGDPTSPDPVKRLGFLASASGQQHLDAIKAYYRNIAVWISPPASHRCFRRRLLWSLLYQHRVLEAVLATPRVPLDAADATLMYEIGAHARDVLELHAGRCISLQLLLDLLGPALGPLAETLDPWAPEPDDRKRDLPPFVDPTPLTTVGLGGALLALREQYPMPSVGLREEVDKAADEHIEKGASVGARLGLEAFGTALAEYSKLSG